MLHKVAWRTTLCNGNQTADIRQENKACGLSKTRDASLLWVSELNIRFSENTLPFKETDVHTKIRGSYLHRNGSNTVGNETLSYDNPA